MTPVFTIEAEKFNAVMKRWLLTASRELARAVNSRMAFLLMRVFALMKPQRVQEARDKVRAYMQQPIGERRFDKSTGKRVGAKSGRVLRRAHLIAQARNAKMGQPGLYGNDMRKASGAVQRRAIGSVGYLKSAMIGAIKAVNGKYGFGQIGRNAKGKTRGIEPNVAFLRLLDKYGITSGRGNVARMKGAKHSIELARPGVNPLATVRLSIGLAQGQEGNVAEEFNGPFIRALQDERIEMERHLAAKLEDAAQEAINGQSR